MHMHVHIEDVLPFIPWLRRYNRHYLKADLFAGLTVAVVALPQSMAYAIIAGLPVQYGLYASIVPTIIGCFWGSSAQLITGPTTTASLVVFSALSSIAQPGSLPYIDLAFLLAAMAGIIRIAMGMARLGVLFNFISHSVLLGFTSGAAILLAGPLAAKLPLCALSGVLIVVAFQLIRVEDIRRSLRSTRSDAAVILVTFLFTVFLNIEFSIYVGVLLSIGLHLAKTSHPRIYSVVPDLGTGQMVGFAQGRPAARWTFFRSRVQFFFVLGISAKIKPLPFQVKNNRDIGVVVFSSLLLFLFMFTGKKRSLDRWEGLIFLIMYGSFITYLIIVE